MESHFLDLERNKRGAPFLAFSIRPRFTTHLTPPWPGSPHSLAVGPIRAFSFLLHFAAWRGGVAWGLTHFPPSLLSVTALPSGFHSNSSWIPLLGALFAAKRCLQGWTKITFPGSVNMRGKNCVLCTCCRPENATVSPHSHKTWEGYFSPAL